MGTDLNTNKLAWESIPAFTGTAEAKVLRDDGTDKAKTMLVRLQAGGCVIPHSHVATVQYDIYDGEYEPKGRTYAAGTYGVLPAHTDFMFAITCEVYQMMFGFNSKSAYDICPVVGGQSGSLPHC